MMAPAGKPYLVTVTPNRYGRWEWTVEFKGRLIREGNEFGRLEAWWHAKKAVRHHKAQTGSPVETRWYG